MYYEVRIQGHLSPQWSEWFGGLTVVNGEDGEALLTGWLADKAALYGILNQIQALNLTLLAVNPLPGSPADSSTGSATDSPKGE